MRPSAARNEVNFCAEIWGTPLLAVLAVDVPEAPAAPLDVWEPPLGAEMVPLGAEAVPLGAGTALVGATPLAAA